MAMSKLVCINKLIHMFAHFGFATQKGFMKCPSLNEIIAEMMQTFRNPTGKKTRNMCGTNKEIQLGNISVIERNAY